MSVPRRSLQLLPLTLVSRGVAFTVPVFLAQWYGVSADMDAFYYALGIPTLLLVVGSSAVGSVLVPALARVAGPTADVQVEDGERADSDSGGALLGSAAGWAAFAATVLGSVLAGVLPVLLAYISDFEPAKIADTQSFCVDLLPFLACVAASGALRAGVEIQGLFSWSTASPLVRTVALLATAVGVRAEGPAGLPFAMFTGALVELVWLATGLWGTPLRPRLALWPASLGPALVRFGPVLVGETLVALNVVVDKVFAALLPEGSVSLLEYADRARVIPMTLFESSLLVVAFNSWARVPADERGAEVRRSLRWVLLLVPPVLGGLYVGRTVAIGVLFERGAFTADHTVGVSAAFGAFLPGVLTAMLAGLAVKAHLLADRARLVLVYGILSFVLNVALDLLLGRFGIAGLALATSLTSLVVAAVSLQRLARELPPGRSWVVPILVTTGSLAVAVATSTIGAVMQWAPDSLTDLRLWAAAVPFVLLLGLGVREARRS